MAKTPYEIRLELLRLATDRAGYDYQNKYNDYQVNREKHVPDEKNVRPDFPTTAEIIKDAEKLNEFVTDGDRKIFYIDLGTLTPEIALEKTKEVMATFKDSKVKISEA